MVNFETDDLDKYTAELEKTKRTYEKFFSNTEQLEYFCLLPLTDSQRLTLLHQVMTNREERLKELQKECSEMKKIFPALPKAE